MSSPSSPMPSSEVPEEAITKLMDWGGGWDRDNAEKAVAELAPILIAEKDKELESAREKLRDALGEAAGKQMAERKCRDAEAALRSARSALEARIKVLQNEESAWIAGGGPQATDRAQGIKLGIDALKAVRDYLPAGDPSVPVELPGAAVYRELIVKLKHPTQQPQLVEAGECEEIPCEVLRQAARAYAEAPGDPERQLDSDAFAAAVALAYRIGTGEKQPRLGSVDLSGSKQPTKILTEGEWEGQRVGVMSDGHCIGHRLDPVDHYGQPTEFLMCSECQGIAFKPAALRLTQPQDEQPRCGGSGEVLLAPFTSGDIGGLIEAVDARLADDLREKGKRRRYTEIREKLLGALTSRRLNAVLDEPSGGEVDRG